MPCGEWGSAVKKTLHHPKAETGARQRFQDTIEAHQNADRALVHLDESGFAQSMPRTHSYALTGQRCLGVHDWQDKSRVNVIGALLNQQLLTVSLFDHAIDADTFLVWLAGVQSRRLVPAQA